MPILRGWLSVLVLLPSFANDCLHAADPGEKIAPDALPHGYHLRDEDISPDKRFGVIHADVEVIDPAKARNYLVALQPFRILSENQGFAFYDEGGSRAMVVEWSKDSSVALLLVGAKWGTIGATLFEIKEARVTRRTDLLAAVTRSLAAKFPKGKVKPYNDTLRFVISDQDDWDLSVDGRQVRIDVAVDTAPNLAPGLAWKGTLKGIWSVNKARWLEQKVAGKTHRNPE